MASSAALVITPQHRPFNLSDLFFDTFVTHTHLLSQLVGEAKLLLLVVRINNYYSHFEITRDFLLSYMCTSLYR